MAIRTLTRFLARRAAALVVELATRAERWLSKQGFGNEEDGSAGVGTWPDPRSLAPGWWRPRPDSSE